MVAGGRGIACRHLVLRGQTRRHHDSGRIIRRCRRWNDCEGRVRGGEGWVSGRTLAGDTVGDT